MFDSVGKRADAEKQWESPSGKKEDQIYLTEL